MMEKETTKLRDISRLSVSQLNAVDLLSTGKSITATAEALGLSREIVSKWKNHNAAFKEALVAKREELWQDADQRLGDLAVKAVDIFASHLDRNSLPAAIAVLKCCGLWGRSTWQTDAGDEVLNTISGIDDLLRQRRKERDG